MGNKKITLDLAEYNRLKKLASKNGGDEKVLFYTTSYGGLWEGLMGLSVYINPEDVDSKLREFIEKEQEKFVETIEEYKNEVIENKNEATKYREYSYEIRRLEDYTVREFKRWRSNRKRVREIARACEEIKKY